MRRPCDDKYVYEGGGWPSTAASTPRPGPSRRRRGEQGQRRRLNRSRVYESAIGEWVGVCSGCLPKPKLTNFPKKAGLFLPILVRDDLDASRVFMAPTTFEAFREYTGWQRPGHDHGCPPVEVVPGVWTAHYHDIDTQEKLFAATKGAPIKMVVNSALSQCACRTGFYGPDVIVMEGGSGRCTSSRQCACQGVHRR